jgi:uncharacterized protein YcbX
MQAQVSSLCRYPVKGLSAECLPYVELQAGQGIPGDRAFALALPTNTFDEHAPQAMRKTEFLMLARQEALARLRTKYDPDTGYLTVQDGTEGILQDVGTSDGRAAINTFFARFLPEDQRSLQPRLVFAPDHSFTDVGVHSPEMMRAVSLINIASVRDLESRISRPLDLRRFRANIYVDGLSPWEELDWVDQEISIGDVRFKGAWPTRRCPATQVNPDTAIRDVNVPKELKRAYGHQNLGIYLYVMSSGCLRLGDRLYVHGQAAAEILRRAG